MKRKSLAWICCAVLSLSGGAADAVKKIASPDDLAKLLAKAQTIDIEGNPPGDWRTDTPVVRYPVRIQRAAEIRQVAEFFRHSELRFNKEQTSAFRDGATIGTDEVTIVTIDSKFSFELLASDLVVFADMLTYSGPDTPGPVWSYFHREFALLIARITRERAKAGTKHQAPRAIRGVVSKEDRG